MLSRCSPTACNSGRDSETCFVALLPNPEKAGPPPFSGAFVFAILLSVFKCLIFTHGEACANLFTFPVKRCPTVSNCDLKGTPDDSHFGFVSRNSSLPFFPSSCSSSSLTLRPVRLLTHSQHLALPLKHRSSLPLCAIPLRFRVFASCNTECVRWS